MNQNTNGKQFQKDPVYYDVLSPGEYLATCVKAEVMPATEYGTSIKLLWVVKVDVGGVQHSAFVNNFVNEFYEPEHKTGKVLAAMGVPYTDGIVDPQKVKGKKAKLLLQPGDPVYNMKLQRQVQYMKILAVNPATRQVPNPVAGAQQAPVQHPNYYDANTAAQVQQPVQQAPRVTSWQPTGQPMPQQTQAPKVTAPAAAKVFTKPTTVNVGQAHAPTQAPAQYQQPAPQAVPSENMPVSQRTSYSGPQMPSTTPFVESQPLPDTPATPEELGF